jgi:Predicted membrane protein
MTEPSTAQRERPGLLGQLIKFGAVGGVGVVINLIVFEALRLTVFEPKVVAHGPLYATIAATLVAIGVNWIGNRYWAFASERRVNGGREALEFFAVSLVGMAIPLACVWVSHYLLGMTSVAADTASNNVVGLALGTAFRFTVYRWWVFAPHRRRAALPPVAQSGLVREG